MKVEPYDGYKAIEECVTLTGTHGIRVGYINVKEYNESYPRNESTVAAIQVNPHFRQINVLWLNVESTISIIVTERNQLVIRNVIDDTILYSKSFKQLFDEEPICKEKE